MAQDVYELGSVFKIFTFALAFEDHTLQKPGRGVPHRPGLQDRQVSPSMKPSTCRPPWRRAISWPSPPTSAPRRSRCAPAPTRQREFLANLGLLQAAEDRTAGNGAPALSPHQLGRRSKPPPSASARAFRSRRSASSPPRRRWSMAAAASRRPSSSRNRRDLRGEQVIKPETIRADARPAALCRDQRHRARRPMSPAMTWAARPARPRCRARMAAISRMPCAPAFCGVFPVHNPRYVVFILLDQPHGTKETGGFALAGWTAAPAVGRVIRASRRCWACPTPRRRPSWLGWHLMTPQSGPTMAGIRQKRRHGGVKEFHRPHQRQPQGEAGLSVRRAGRAARPMARAS